MERLVNLYSDLSTQLVLKGPLGRQQKISIAAAVSLVVLYLARKAVTPPARLRHLPYVGLFTFLNAFMRRKLMSDISSNVTLPAAMKSSSGLYTRFDQNGWSVHITRPESAKKFLLKTDIFAKADIGGVRGTTLFGKFLFQRNILMLNGHEWKAQRKVANPAFHRSMPVELFAKLAQKTINVMDRAESETINFHQMTERFALDVIGLAGFDFDFHAIEDPKSEWVVRYRDIMEATLNPWFVIFYNLDMKYLFLFPGRKRMHRELDIFLGMMDEVIAHKRQVLKDQQSKVPESERDLLTLMIEAENSGEGAMTNEELRNNLCLFFLAGHDTTANALAYAVYHLAKNPDMQRKAREEAIKVLGDEPQDVFPTLEQTREFPYINMIIKETLRITPPVAAIVSRETTQDTELEGQFIPKGTKTTVDIYELQHNPTVWKDPETFRPERFEPGGEAEELAGSGMSWIPFSNGQRQCIGMNFSLAEQRVFLPMLLRKYEWELPKDSIHKDKIQTVGTGLVKPKELMLTFKKRY
ncbi:hypothetical protein O0I10_005214 [Lichtheimia ornata]|uniref:Cytochrome p450 n=1 Tax=Lichtheimia ornata TaxID=688661 RepID=A0AAD7V6H4_9FUNG|nr:uncharacterized protein O0I10_005214 [Lichtheimia ornata]KAJ8659175.1 hypothetical protein O0I10_005214 [Lichtheimia ornata]